MSTTPNLLVSHIAASQNQKEVTANTAFDTFDEAFCGRTGISVGNIDTTVPSQTFTDCWIINLTGSLSATRKLILPAGIVKPFVVVNSCANTGSLDIVGITVQIGATPTLTQFVPNDGNYYMFWSDGLGSIQRIEPVKLDQVPITLKHYKLIDLPSSGTEGDVAFCTDGLKSFETTGHGTGVPVYFSQSNPSIGPVWRVFRDDSQVLN